MRKQRKFWMAGGLALLAAVLSAPAAALPERDPFWPIGYTPAVEAVTPEGETVEKKKSLLDLSRLTPEQQAIIRSRLQVSGILKQGSQRVAIINGDVVREGDNLILKVEGEKYRFKVRSLKQDNIVIEPLAVADDTGE